MILYSFPNPYLTLVLNTNMYIISQPLVLFCYSSNRDFMVIQLAVFK